MEKTIVLPEKEYQHFTQNLLRDHDFIRDNNDLMYVKDDVWHCLLVAGEESREGILVESEGSSYARYSSVLPDASAFMHPQYQALEAVKRKLEEAVDYIVREGTEATTNGGYYANHREWMETCEIEDEWRETVYDMLSEREEVQEVNHIGKDFEVCFYTQYCPHVIEEPETMNQQINL